VAGTAVAAGMAAVAGTAVADGVAAVFEADTTDAATTAVAGTGMLATSGSVALPVLRGYGKPPGITLDPPGFRRDEDASAGRKDKLPFNAHG
jgi:hypothetical protein